MKKIIFTICLFIMANITNAQKLPVNAKSGKITFMKTVDATGLTAQQIFDTAKKWGGENNLTIKSIKPGSQLVYDATFEVEYPATKSSTKINGNIHYKFQIDTKEGKFRYVLIDFTHTGAPEDGGALENKEPVCKFTNISSRSWTVVKQSTNKQALKIIKSLTDKIKAEQNDPTKSDDW